MGPGTLDTLKHIELHRTDCAFRKKYCLVWGDEIFTITLGDKRMIHFDTAPPTVCANLGCSASVVGVLLIDSKYQARRCA